MALKDILCIVLYEICINQNDNLLKLLIKNITLLLLLIITFNLNTLRYQTKFRTQSCYIYSHAGSPMLLCDGEGHLTYLVSDNKSKKNQIYMKHSRKHV